MRRVAVLTALITTLVVPALALSAAPAASRASATSAPQMAAFHFRLGGGGITGRRRYGYGGFGRSRSRGVLRRVVHALAFAYLLHLFFTHGGLSLLLWLVIIGAVVHLLRRRRRRRWSY